jgi:hypothetical protein
VPEHRRKRTGLMLRLGAVNAPAVGPAVGLAKPCQLRQVREIVVRYGLAGEMR